jgi:hypothetical protein
MPPTTKNTVASSKPRKYRPKETCSSCGKLRVVHRREGDDKLCHNCYEMKKALYNKLIAIFNRDSHCDICDITNIPPDLFHFHHLDPNDKEEKISNLLKVSIQKAQPEIDKCQLLCILCHYQQHASDAIEKIKFIHLVANSNDNNPNVYLSYLPQNVQTEIKQQIINNTNKKKYRQPSITTTYTCKYCGEKFTKISQAAKPKQQFCSKKCSINNLNKPKISPKQLKLIED